VCVGVSHLSARLAWFGRNWGAQLAQLDRKLACGGLSCWPIQTDNSRPVRPPDLSWRHQLVSASLNGGSQTVFVSPEIVFAADCLQLSSSLSLSLSLSAVLHKPLASSTYSARSVIIHLAPGEIVSTHWAQLWPKLTGLFMINSNFRPTISRAPFASSCSNFLGPNFLALQFPPSTNCALCSAGAKGRPLAVKLARAKS